MRLCLARGGYRSRDRRRKQIVEPVFGQIKAALGFTRFLMRSSNTSGGWSAPLTTSAGRTLFGRAALDLARRLAGPETTSAGRTRGRAVGRSEGPHA